ncbi:glycoside hydrolase family 26 protein [Micromonospora sp. LH3U1]|uniref:glycoside hydrolase family 26 protein n=1 Tax=Micromonospora sp. LH3U1 TaxID=3018339 RepID=UPI00234B35CB|nr:glycosyl hydrolase [Micromonospora sp. LH3U1]WCN80642.1 glycosyl hydrolase [Micromonospora sp. LH3U1]
MKTKYLITFLVIFALALTEVAVLRTVDIRVSSSSLAAPDGGGPAAVVEAPPAYDVTALRSPKGKYLGVSVQGGAEMDRITSFATETGKKPNLVAVFESFDDKFAASEVRELHQYGALAVIRWEPFNIPMRDIAAGKHDAYVKEFAASVRMLNLPIALTFAHEMNGPWYSWGTKANKAAEYVAAWRHLHEIFAQQDATNVIWTWTPNVINYLRKTSIKALYPGDAYVDWVGMDGYYTIKGQKTFDSLFGPTIREIRTFTSRPLLIVETGAEPSTRRPAQITDLLSNVARRKDMIGVAYFNINGSGKWNIDKDSAARRSYKRGAATAVFGFDVRTAK